MFTMHRRYLKHFNKPNRSKDKKDNDAHMPESCQNDKKGDLKKEESSESSENQPEVVPLDDQS